MGSYTQIMKKKMHKNHILQFVLLICLACARGDANVCQAVRTEERCRPTIDMNNFQIPEDFDLDRVVEEVTKGSGWIVLKSMYSAEDVKLAKDIVYQYNKADNITMDRNEDARHKSRDEAHNKYNGLVWALFNKGRIFEKMAQHPVILNISNVILGESSIISSYAANTVLPGQGGQLPHLDYPYYRAFYPSTNPNIMDTAPPLSMQFVTLLTDFTKDNGGTALRPHSHHVPKYPDDEADFHANMVQVEGKAGDVVVFHGAMQHCAMPNKGNTLRTGILQHMAPVYIKPFEAMADYVREDIKSGASPAIRRILALDHPYPIMKQ